MGEAIGQVLSFGVGVALSPVPIIAVVLMLGTPRARSPKIYFAMGKRAERLLDELKSWMGDHDAGIMAAVCLVIGAKLVGDGITGLS
jgi:hypothetical protein